MFYSEYWVGASMTVPRYHQIECSAALNRVAKMPFSWSLNPYKGCAHACGYCYARRYHEWLDLTAADFEREIFVKTNVVEVLRRELSRRSWRRESVALGTSTDPYQAAEARYRLSRGCLEAFRDFASPVAITTKGTLIVRDLDLLQDLSRLVRVHVSLVTLDADLARRLEPGAPSPQKRLRVLARLASARVDCSVFVAPVLPGLTDGLDSLRDLYRACADAGAGAVHAMPLRLQGSVKPHFLSVLEAEFPRLAAAYKRGYRGSSNAPQDYQQTLRERASVAKAHAGFTPQTQRAQLPRHGTQLPLPS
jgi:DNA repair photolyase